MKVYRPLTATDGALQGPPPWTSLDEVFTSDAYTKGAPPITSGFASIDNALRGGFRPGCVYVIAGRTGSAKSTLILNVARKVALLGHKVLLHKLEEHYIEAAWRIHAAAAGVDLKVLMDGQAEAGEADLQKLDDAQKVLAGIPLRLSGERDLGRIIRTTEAHAGKGGELVLVDQLSHVQIPDVDIGYQHATRASNALRMLAVDCNVPVAVVVQVNRAASKGDSTLTCNDLRDSGAIENDAAAVLLIDRVTRPEGLAHVGHREFLLSIIVGKNRYGALRTDKPLDIAWWPPCCRMEEMAL
jgi:replicative DNA helicase